MLSKPTKEIFDWATNAGSPSDIANPGTTKIEKGWIQGEEPSYKWFNWVFQSIGEWQEWSNSLIDEGVGNVSLGEATDGSGLSCTFLGHYAGNGTSGNGLTTVGYEAGSGSLANDGLVAIGQYAGKDSGNGVQNVAIGQSAGRLGLTGSYGVYIGRYAGADSTALGTNTLGSYNVAIGEDTGRFDTGSGQYAGSHQVWIGSYAGKNRKSTISGEDYNVGIGYWAARASDGSRNVNIGYKSGQSLSGSDNVYLGTESAFDKTGSYNVGIGYQSFNGASDAKVWYSVAIGHETLDGNIDSFSAPGLTVEGLIAIGKGCAKRTTTTLKLDGGIFIGIDQGQDYVATSIANSRPIKIGCAAGRSIIEGYMDTSDDYEQMFAVNAMLRIGKFNTSEAAGNIGSLFPTYATGSMYFNTTDNLFYGYNGSRWEMMSGIVRGSGTPEGVVTAVVGALYIDTAGTVGATLYVKESGTGNTGWYAV